MKKNITIKLLVIATVCVSTLTLFNCDPVHAPKFMKVKVKADYIRDRNVSGCPVVDPNITHAEVYMGVEDLSRPMTKIAEDNYVLYDLEVRVGFPSEEYNGGSVNIGVGDAFFEGASCRSRAHFIAFNGVGIGAEWIHVNSDGTKYLLIRFDINGYPHPE